jgi:DNA-binding response OmpR family regulator
MEAAADATAAPSGVVLCIEDHVGNMALVEDILAAYPGIRLIKAYNGRDGVRLALDEQPDLVLLDMGLPDIGGLEVVRALNEAISRRRLRVVLLTGEPFSMDIVKAMSLGAHEYWPKPFNVEQMRAGLLRLLGLALRQRPA